MDVPVRIALDSSALRAAFPFDGVAFRYLQSVRSANRDLHLWIPEVVDMEVRAMFREQALNHRKRAIEAIQDLRRFGVEADASGVHDQGVVAASDAQLTRLLDSLHAEFLPLPEIPHAEVLAALMAGKKPFSESRADKGYRDYLIWKSIAARVRSDRQAEGKLVIVTKDGDFTDQGGKLPEHLIAELGSARLEVSAVASLSDLVTKVIKPALPLDERARAELETHLSELRAFIESSLNEDGWLQVNVPDYWDEQRVIGAGTTWLDVETVEIQNVWDTGDGAFAADVRVFGSCEVTYVVHEDDIGGLIPARMRGLMATGEGGYYEGEREARIAAIVQVAGSITPELDFDAFEASGPAVVTAD